MRGVVNDSLPIAVEGEDSRVVFRHCRSHQAFDGLRNNLKHAALFNDRDALKQLAEVWDESLPAARNTAYIERAKELERDLEAALAARLEERAREG